MARQLTYGQRAERIVDRIIPLSDMAPHGFYEHDQMVERSKIKAERNRLYWRVWARLKAKVEGGQPSITIPQDCAHLFGPGDAMYDVAKELEAHRCK